MHTAPVIRRYSLIRPYQLLWFNLLPAVVIALWLRGGDVPLGDLALVICALMLGEGGITALNDICDTETDRLSTEPERHRRPLAAGTLPLGWARLQVAVLLAGGLAFAFVVSPGFGLLVAAGILAGAVYSVRPVRVAGRPLVSQLFWVVFWIGLYFSVYVALDGDLEAGWLYLLGTVLFVAIGETLAKDLRDLENDRAAGKHTTPVVYGARPAALANLVAFAGGSVAWSISPLLAEPSSERLSLALAVVLLLWCGRAFILVRDLGRAYTKQAARSLHEGSIRVFLTVNLLFIGGLHP